MAATPAGETGRLLAGILRKAWDERGRTYDSPAPWRLACLPFDYAWERRTSCMYRPRGAEYNPAPCVARYPASWDPGSSLAMPPWESSPNERRLPHPDLELGSRTMAAIEIGRIVSYLRRCAQDADVGIANSLENHADVIELGLYTVGVEE